MFAIGLAAFFLFGVLIVLVGASHDALSDSLGLSLAQTSLLGASVSLGLSAGLLVAGPLVDRLPRRPIFQVAVGISAGSLLGVGADMSFSRALVHLALVGLGAGAYETVLNVVVVQRYGEAATRRLAVVHAAATAGAMLAPLMIGWLLASLSWTAVFQLVGAAHLGLLLWGSTVSMPQAPPTKPAGAGVTASLRSPTLLLLCGIAAAYIGIESAVTLLTVPYASDGLGLDAERGRWAISSFWLGLLLGRLVLMRARGPARPHLLVLAGSAAAAILFFGFGRQPGHIELLCASLGFVLGGAFPLLMTLAGQRFPDNAGTAMGLVAGVGSLGGFLVPWLAGWAGERMGVVVAVSGLALPAAGIALAALLLMRHRAQPAA